MAKGFGEKHPKNNRKPRKPRKPMDIPGHHLFPEVAALVRTCRCGIVYVSSELEEDPVAAAEYKGPNFGYTIGLWENYDHPEVIVLGWSMEKTHNLLNKIARLVERGAKMLPIPHRHSGILDSGRINKVMFAPISNQIMVLDPDRYVNYFAKMSAYYGGWVPVVQLAYPDDKGVSPFEEGCDPAVEMPQAELLNWIDCPEVPFDLGLNLN